MRCSCRFSRAMILGTAAVWLAVQGTTCTVSAEPPASSAAAESAGDRDEPIAGDVQRLRQEVETLRSELREVLDALKRIERSLEPGAEPSEFSPVTIHIQSEAGRPLDGFRVEMESAQKEGRRLFVSGRSDQSGLALSRHLPYGEYRIKVSEPSGWSTMFAKVQVELGQALEKVVTAPDPRERGTLVISSSIDARRLEGLKFGEIREHRGAIREHRGAFGYSVSSSPEPGEKPSRFASFPELGEGITEAAIQLRLGVERPVEQPEGTLQNWRWAIGDSAVTTILASTEGLLLLKSAGGKSARPKDSAEFFAPGDQPTFGGDYSVGYLVLEIERADEKESTLEVAPGEVSVVAYRVLGKADKRARASLEVDGESNVWLQAHIRGDSGWVPRILDLEGWERSTGIQHLATKRETLAAGETVRVTVKPPALKGN